MKKIILFNGPAHSGKDTAVLAVRALLSPQCSEGTGYAVHDKMAYPLKKAVHSLFGLFFEPEYYDDPKNIHLKDQPLVSLFGMSPRQAYIWLSEECVKPKLGKDAFGQMAVHNIKRNKHSTVHLFSDAGFVDEMGPIIEEFGAENVLVVELHSTRVDTGKRLTFEGDSRGYIGESLVALYPKVCYKKVFNDIGSHEDKEFFRMLVIRVVKTFLEIE